MNHCNVIYHFCPNAASTTIGGLAMITDYLATEQIRYIVSLRRKQMLSLFGSQMQIVATNGIEQIMLVFHYCRDFTLL